MAGTGNFWIDNIDFSWTYTFPASAWYPIITPFQFTLGSSLLDNSSVQIGYNSTSPSGSVEATHLAYVQYDKSAPTTSISYTRGYTSGPKTWVSSTTLFTLMPSDSGGSGVNRTYYKWSGSSNLAWTQYTARFSLTGAVNGSTYTISYCSWDNAGNNETLHTLTVLIDTIAPTTSISYIPVYTNGPKNWINSSTVFTLAANDDGGSGKNMTFYKWSGSGSHAWAQYTAPFTLAGMTNGTYTISWCSWDNVGNNETLQTLTVFIDTIAPTTSISYIPVYTNGPKNWVNSSTVFTLAANDDGGSGKNMTFYKWSGSGSHAWAQYTAPFTLAGMTNGTYTISWCSWDNVGNNETLRSQVVYIDTITPTTTMSCSPIYTSGSKHFVSALTSFTLVMNDSSGSGVNATYYKWNGPTRQSWTEYIGFFQITGAINGSMYMISWCSWDNAGNNETLRTLTVLIDTIGPTTTIIQPTYLYKQSLPYTKNFTTGSATFVLNAMDNPGGAGLFYTEYRITANGVVGTPSNYTGPFSLGSFANGTYTIEWASVDNVYNFENLNRITVYIDAITPATSITQPTYLYNSGSKNFTTGNAMFTLSPTDNAGGSGVAITRYKVNGGLWATGTSFSINSYTGVMITNGTYTIAWNSTDNVGHVEGTHHLTVYIDMTSPTTLITQPQYIYNSGSKNFTNGSALFTLSATDNTGGSGIMATSYWIAVNGVSGSWTSYTGAFTLGSSANGTYTIAWYSKDNAGNVEGTHHLTTYIDMIAPTTFIVYTLANAPNNVNSTTMFSLAGLDNSGGSGVASIEYQYTGSGGNWIMYTGSFTLSKASNGSCTILYRSIDNAGNVELSNTLIVQLTVLPGPSFWTQYGIWIIVALIGVAMAIAVGIGVSARKKKTAARSRTSKSKAMSVGKAKTQQAYVEPGLAGEAAASATAAGASLASTGDKGTRTQETVSSPPAAVVNLYCANCEQWIQPRVNAVIEGSETCPRCAQPLYFVPVCDNCGNKIIKSVAELTPFKDSSMACEKCGSKMRIQ